MTVPNVFNLLGAWNASHPYLLLEVQQTSSDVSYSTSTILKMPNDVPDDGFWVKTVVNYFGAVVTYFTYLKDEQMVAYFPDLKLSCYIHDKSARARYQSLFAEKFIKNNSPDYEKMFVSSRVILTPEGYFYMEANYSKKFLLLQQLLGVDANFLSYKLVIKKDGTPVTQETLVNTRNTKSRYRVLSSDPAEVTEAALQLSQSFDKPAVISSRKFSEILLEQTIKEQTNE